MKFGNFMVSLLLRSPLHGMLSGMFLIISMRGRKSGRVVSTPVNYVADGERLVVTSLRTRTWWRNLRGGASVTVRLRGKDLPAQAEAVEAAGEVTAGFRRMLESRPPLAQAFGVTRDESGQLKEADLSRLAGERLLIYLTLASPAA
jgi:deazaflavin-dependent oxidoreductase (nitroreductase family)